MVYFIAGSACSDRLFKPYVHLEFLRKGSYRMDFKYEMVVPNEDLPCKFFIFEGFPSSFSCGSRTMLTFDMEKNIITSNTSIAKE